MPRRIESTGDGGDKPSGNQPPHALAAARSSVGDLCATDPMEELVPQGARQRYPVDDITVRSACELQTRVRNKKIVVAYDVAEVSTPTERFMNVDLETVCRSCNG
jgi:hypothetical protein